MTKPITNNETNKYIKKSFARVRSSHRRCSVKKMFLKISQISLETVCVGVFCLFNPTRHIDTLLIRFFNLFHATYLWFSDVSKGLQEKNSGMKCVECKQMKFSTLGDCEQIQNHQQTFFTGFIGSLVFHARKKTNPS